MLGEIAGKPDPGDQTSPGGLEPVGEELFAQPVAFEIAWHPYSLIVKSEPFDDGAFDRLGRGPVDLEETLTEASAAQRRAMASNPAPNSTSWSKPSLMAAWHTSWV